jgi:hypothetical protein
MSRKVVLPGSFGAGSVTCSVPQGHVFNEVTDGDFLVAVEGFEVHSETRFQWNLIHQRDAKQVTQKGGK